MKQCDCNILHVVVSRIQLLVNKNFFHLLFFHLLSSFIYYFFDLIVKKYETNNIPKCTPFWHEMFKIVSLSDAPPDPLVGRGFLPSAIAASRLRRLQFPPLACLYAKTEIPEAQSSPPWRLQHLNFFHLQYVPLLEIS